MYYRIYICFLFALLNACHIDRQNNEETKTESTDYFTIDFTEAVNNTLPVQLSEIASKIEYIPLETQSCEFIWRIEDAKIGREFLFILANRKVLQFNLDGSFVRSIGNLGRGPQEYTSARCFSIDENKEYVFIHSNDQQLLVFDFEGKFIEKIQFPKMGYGLIVWFQDSLFLQYSEGDFDLGGLIFTERTKQGDTLQFVPNYHGFKKMPSKIILTEYFNRNKFYSYNKHLYFKSNYNDTIYTINSKGQIYPKYNVDLKHFKLPEKYFYNKIKIKDPKNYFWFGIHESNRFIFINYSSYSFDSENNPGGIAIFDKKTIKSYSISNNINNGSLFEDYFNGPRFVPRYVHDTVAFNFIDAYTLKQHIDTLILENNSSNNNKLYSKLKGLSDNDNPIMQIVLLKE